jgi:hypothetical protein
LGDFIRDRLAGNATGANGRWECSSPEVYPTHARAGGFAFVTTIGRFAGAGLTFVIGALNTAVGLGTSLSLTAIFFVIGLLLLPLARDSTGKLGPEG